MNVITETELLERIRAFLDRHEMAPTTFGRKATGEPQLISSIEGGRSPSLKVVNRVIAFMAETDEEAALQAKLHAPIEPREEEEQPLPFSSAPVNPTGASSPTSSSTTERPTPPSSSDSCHCSEDQLAGPSIPTEAGRAPDLSSSSAEIVSPTVGSNSLSADEPGRRASIKTPGAPSFFNGTER